MCSGTPRISMTSAMVSSTQKLLIRRHPDSLAFTSELVDHGHQPELAAIVGLGLH
jgi:hypothetical protein